MDESEMQGETVGKLSVSRCTVRTAPLTDCHRNIKLHVGKRHRGILVRIIVASDKAHVRLSEHLFKCMARSSTSFYSPPKICQEPYH